MLETITKGFRSARFRLQGYRELDEDTLEEVLGDIRTSLLEADVEVGVAKRFLAEVKAKAVGEVVQVRAKDAAGQQHRVSPQDQFVKICHDELMALMDSGEEEGLQLKPKGITSIMMVGLQGSGKTTTAGKLANLYKSMGKKVMLVAADIYRPAAIDQLQVLGQRVDVPVFTVPGMLPPDLCEKGLWKARSEACDIVIFDTAGRLSIDEQLMAELGEIRKRSPPDHVLLVVDAMIGQDAVTTARHFNDKVGIDGVVLTKLDGDARGGAALSVKMVTGAPVRFVGLGEGLDKLEPFRAEGMASRILGMGDVVSLVNEFSKHVDEKKAEQDARRLLSGKFTLVDFLEQIRLLKKMGSLRDVMEKLPFFGDAMADGVKFDDKQLVVVESIIQSMTPLERRKPQLINARRVQRIARGSGRKPQDVLDLMQRFDVMRQMMARIGQAPGLLSKLPGFGQLAQLNKLKGGGVDDFFDQLQGMGGGGAGAAMPGMPAMGKPGSMPNLGAMPNFMPSPGSLGSMASLAGGLGMPGGLGAAGWGPGAGPGGSRKDVDRDRRKQKNKAAAQARKKNRKK
ncbi:MAG: signal recognition particle protein [Deltaproteobacteria bacterium]|nr:signal recognition particle protein [Deltaproteobacteria bacterium]